MEPIYIYFARRRTRRFHMQATHVLVDCIVDATRSLCLEQRHHKFWRFYTTWSFAKKLLRRGFKQVTMTQLEHENGENSTVIPRLAPDSPSFDIWPGVFRHPAEPRDDRLPRVDGAGRQRRRRARGGVRVVAPNAGVLRRPPAAGAPPPDPDHAMPGPDDDDEGEGEVHGWSSMSEEHPSEAGFV